MYEIPMYFNIMDWYMTYVCVFYNFVNASYVSPIFQ